MATVYKKILHGTVSDLIGNSQCGAYRSRHVTASLAQEEQDRRSILFGLTDPPQHVLGCPRLCQSSQPRRLTEWRVNVAWAECVDPNGRKDRSRFRRRVWIRTCRCAPRKGVLRMAPFGGKRSRKLMDSGFGSIVCSCIDPSVADMATHTSDQYDAS